jgi:polyphosphate kinase 2 (PPK2 family)
MGKDQNKTKRADKDSDHSAKGSGGLDPCDAYRRSPILDDFAAHPEGASIKLDHKFYERELKELQVEPMKMKYWIKHVGHRITEPFNPRGCNVVVLGTPSDQQKTQWYFQRYVENFPSLPDFERMVVRSGITLLKHWFSVSDDEQEARFRSRLQDSALNCIRHLLSKVPYEDMTPEAIELPPRKGSGDVQRPPSTNGFSCPNHYC